MPWIYLLGALVFPPVFILWRPRERLTQQALRFRLAASVVVVWMLAILWSLGGTLRGDSKEGLDIDERNYSDPLLPRANERDPDDPANPSPLPSTLPTRAPKEPGDPDEISDRKDQDISWGWTYEGPPDTALTLTLGWIPGLAYAGLLMLARRSLAPQTAQGYEEAEQQGWPGQQGGGGPYA